MQEFTEQYELEEQWSTRKTDEIIMDSIWKDIPDEMDYSIVSIMENLDIVDIEKVFTKLFCLVLNSKTSKPIQAIAVQLGYAAGKKDPISAFELGIVIVKNCKNSGLYELVKDDKEDQWYVSPNFHINKLTRKKIERLGFLPPMQLEPLDWVNNSNGGWLYETKSIFLGKKFVRHDEYVAYDAINKLQKVKWTIDPETYLNEKNTNRNLNKKKFLRVMDEYLDKPFNFVWRYDSRGRMYSSGYDLNIQSNEYGKALISLYDKEEVSNLDNLRIAIANHAGLDKLTWNERISWCKEQEVTDFTDVIWDEPMLGRKAVRALRDVSKGKKSGYVMSLDATCSGLQLMAVLSGCKDTALLTNCIDDTKRYDLYTEVNNMMNKELDRPIPRKIIKQCIMTH